MTTINVQLKRSTPEGRLSAGRTIYSFLSIATAQRKEARKDDKLKTEWKKFVNETASDGPFKNYLLNLSEVDKASYKPWVEHLKLLEQQKKASPR